uniref:Uncharacterized protein n=1 Tax=Picea sitchensis TaxID=3332 RepID=A0A6B9XT15_PICSI|nr:hypothetical protein Q903MT_gene4201 [Picea sitchensis]
MTVYLVDLHVDLDLAGVARTWRTSLVICWERGGPFPLVQPRLHYFRGASIIKSKLSIHFLASRAGHTLSRMADLSRRPVATWKQNLWRMLVR